MRKDEATVMRQSIVTAYHEFIATRSTADEPDVRFGYVCINGRHKGNAIIPIAAFHLFVKRTVSARISRKAVEATLHALGARPAPYYLPRDISVRVWLHALSDLDVLGVPIASHMNEATND